MTPSPLAPARRGAHRLADLRGAHALTDRFDDIQFERREYDPQAAYAQSKTATSLFAVEATRRWAADGIVANAVNPGVVATGLQRNFTQKQKDYLAEAGAAGAFAYKTAGQGGATTLVAAVAPEFAHTDGHYLDDGREAHTVPNDAGPFENSHVSNSQPRARWDYSDTAVTQVESCWVPVSCPVANRCRIVAADPPGRAPAELIDTVREHGS